MSRWKRSKAVLGQEHLAGKLRRMTRAAISENLRQIVPRSLSPFVLGVFVASLAGAESLRAERSDTGVYARAVEFCRGLAKRPMALDIDRRVLCFDGAIRRDRDFALVDKLVENGLFVVRSIGGNKDAAMALADRLRERNATVVVYDYCFSACASFLLVATEETYVVRDTIVAWHHPNWPHCASLEKSNDGGPRRLERTPCSQLESYEHAEQRAQERDFYASRRVDPDFVSPPESFPIRNMLRRIFEATGTYPDVLWTWNPRYSAKALKTRIIYEAYPGSQAEFDALLSRFGLQGRVLYDP